MTTLLAWIGLIVALGAGFYAWKLSHELDTARTRLDRYNKALFDVNDEVRNLRAQLAERTGMLQVEIMRRTGTPAFTPEMTVHEAHLLHPQAAEVLAGFHLGGCSSCAVEDEDTLAMVCSQSGVPVEQVVASLNVLLGDAVYRPGANGNGSNGGNGYAGNGNKPYVPAPVKLPNVEFEI